MAHCGHAGDDFARRTRAEHDAECLKPFSKVSIIFNSTTELRPSHPPYGQPPNRYPPISSVCNGQGASYEQWEKSFPFAASFEKGDEPLPFSAVGHRRRRPKLPSCQV